MIAYIERLAVLPHASQLCWLKPDRDEVMLGPLVVDVEHLFTLLMRRLARLAFNPWELAMQQSCADG